MFWLRYEENLFISKKWLGCAQSKVTVEQFTRYWYMGCL
jgi:hypothetical protein